MDRIKELESEIELLEMQREGVFTNLENAINAAKQRQRELRYMLENKQELLARLKADLVQNPSY